jgi:hypothetical protein
MTVSRALTDGMFQEMLPMSLSSSTEPQDLTGEQLKVPPRKKLLEMIADCFPTHFCIQEHQIHQRQTETPLKSSVKQLSKVRKRHPWV